MLRPPPPVPVVGRTAGVVEVGAEAAAAEAEQRRGSLGLAALAGWLEEAPAWLTSALLHLTVLLLLAMLAMGASRDDRLRLTVGVAEDLGEQLIEESLDLTTATEIELDEQLLTPDFLPEVADPLATPPEAPVTPLGESLSSDLPSITPGVALSGRTPGRKAALLKALGGTEATENAVLMGLRWLERQQKSDGSWSLVGPYNQGGTTENREAATAMALLAFQGAGKLPDSPRADFGPQVRRGWIWLLKRQKPDGSFFHLGGSNHRFYTEAQCTIAVCELLAMTGDDQYREPATKAVNYLVSKQSELGGWRYSAGSTREPSRQSDLSVTGWVLMALKSARMAGIDVPSPVFERIEGYLDRVSRADTKGYAPVGSRYVYDQTDQFMSEAIPAMTAVGLLCREYLGWRGDDRRIESGIKFLLTHPARWRRPRVDIYYWYYATQAILHAGGDDWPKWNRVLREVLPDNQVQRGKEKGSWDPRDGVWHQMSGGRLYTTCLAIYTLEVYYRHLPLYKQQATQR